MATPKKKRRRRGEFIESWQLSTPDGKQVALISRTLGGMPNVYLGGSDEPVYRSFKDWKDAEDFVWAWIRKGMPKRN